MPIVGIPKVYHCGYEGEYNVMVMDLLGESLDQTLKRLGKFSLKTVLLLADQLVQPCYGDTA